MFMTMAEDPNIQTIVALNFALILQLLCVAISVSVDPYVSKDNKRRVFGIILHILFLPDKIAVDAAAF